MECVVEMVKKGRGGGHHSMAEPTNVKVVCPLCRLHNTSESISYVQQQAETYLDGDGIQVSSLTLVGVYVHVCLCVGGVVNKDNSCHRSLDEYSVAE